MGMQNTVKIAIELKRLNFFESMESVIDMGAQEIHMNKDEFQFLMDYGGIEYDIKDFPNLNYPNSPRQITKPFWEALGFSEVSCLDYNNLHGSIYCDLNFPFENQKYFGKYDMVTDFGNNEHPFNVIEAYKTMHKLCKVNGYMWIHQDLINGNGLFNFDLSFFEGMAAANDYGIVYNSFVVTTEDNNQHHIPCERSILDLFDYSKLRHLGVNYIFKKTKDEEFKYFYQGTVTKEKKYPYTIQFISKIFPPERYYIPSKVAFGTRKLFKMFSKSLVNSIMSKVS